MCTILKSINTWICMSLKICKEKTFMYLKMAVYRIKIAVGHNVQLGSINNEIKRENEDYKIQ